jgi:hypothetical protein
MTTCYISGMPSYAKKTKEKKSEMLGIKIEPADKSAMVDICQAVDRPLGYVARELMRRGLAAYRRDGFFQEPEKNPYERPVVKVKTEAIAESPRKRTA